MQDEERTAESRRAEGEEGGGALEAIWIKRARRGPMDAVDEALLIQDRGLEGNANQGGKRQVTLLDADGWRAAEEELGASLDPRLRRANLLVRGLDLRQSRGRTLAVGDCRLLIQGETRPCRLMDEGYPGLQDALASDWRGGVYGEVVAGGAIRVGAPVSWVPA